MLWKERAAQIQTELEEYVRLTKVERESSQSAILAHNSNPLLPFTQMDENPDLRSENISGVLGLLLSKIIEDKETISEDAKLLTFKVLAPTIEFR